VRVPSGEPELVRAAGAGDPAAVAALWDAYGPRVFAFCQRMLGGADAAADAAQDAFLLAHAELGSLARSGESFGPAVSGAARTTCYELLARDAGDGRRGPASRLSAAAARLRPQQRAALALTGLEALSYAEIATVLGIGAEGVGELLARARLRLHDELHGTALAAAAVRSPDCEDVVPLLAAADGELDATDAAWADPHVEQCPTCPRSRRAMDETAATYAAWSPAVPPAWLGEATLAELGVRAPAAGPGGGHAAGGAWTTPRPRLSAALLGAALLGVACAALLVAASGSLRQRDPVIGGASLPEAARSLQVAGVPATRAARPAARKRAPHRARRGRTAQGRPRRVALTPGRAVRPVTAPPQPATRRPPVAPVRPPASRPKRRRTPAPAGPVPTHPATTTTVPTPPTPANPAAPADELPGAGAAPASDATAGAAPASAAQAPPSATAAKPSATFPPPVSGAHAAATPVWGAPASAPSGSGAHVSAPPTASAGGQRRHRSGGRHADRPPSRPCPRPHGYRHR
jgi:DNA-directed RNA polymerase specialized sigma24 family protein